MNENEMKKIKFVKSKKQLNEKLNQLNHQRKIKMK